MPLEGRQTAKSVIPSPSKSPGTGTSPFTPHCCTMYWRGELLGIMNQVPVDGRR